MKITNNRRTYSVSDNEFEVETICFYRTLGSFEHLDVVNSLEAKYGISTCKTCGVSQ